MMTFEEAYNSTTGQGGLSEAEARLLWDVASTLTGSILEVGSYYGKSTMLLARLERPVLAVDPFDGFDSDTSGDVIHGKLLEGLKERGLTNVTVYRCRIERWKCQDVSFAYLDGDHTYNGTLNQIAVARKCGAQKVCIHDYAESGGGLQVAGAVRYYEARRHLKLVKVVERMAYCDILKGEPK